jgi:hypothetical protein
LSVPELLGTTDATALGEKILTILNSDKKREPG